MKHLFTLLLLISSLLVSQVRVKTGIENLRDSAFIPLVGKRVGLITNPTGVDRNLRATIDILKEQKSFELVALFGPEHGVRGDYSAGDLVSTYTDPASGLVVYSLYGETRKPTREMLKGIDILVYDIQDIGCRSYTYISTLGLAMEAAAEYGIEFLVLDRPNPLGGNRVEGNLVEEGFFSFVSQFSVPYVYGLTPGEFATFINEHGLLPGGKKCKLSVVKMSGWKRNMVFMDAGLPWVPPSPHIPSAESAFYYVASGILGELGYISEGVGYTLPFQVFAAEWINRDSLMLYLDSLELKGVKFRPITFKPYYGKHAKKTLHGVQIHFTHTENPDLMKIQFHFLEAYNKLYPDKNPFIYADSSRFKMFDKVCGTNQLRSRFSAGLKVSDINQYLDKDIENYKKTISPYLLY